MGALLRYYLTVILSSLVLAPVLHAADASEEDLLLILGEEMISIATGGEQSLARAPAVASVITAEDIEAMGATDLDQVLETVPGLHVSRSSLYLNPVYSIRGIRTDANPHVLVLMNGIPLTQLFQGDRGVNSTLPVTDIARVEVIRGPGSAIYGAEAFSGVINVITKSAKDINGTQISGELGSFNTRRTSFLHGSSLEKTDIALYIEYRQTDGDDGRTINSDAQNVFDTTFDTNASLAPGSLDTRGKRLDIRLDAKRDRWRFRLWNWRLRDTGVGPGLAQTLDPTGRTDINNYLADATYHNPDFAPHVDVKAQLSYMDINTRSEQRLFPRGTVLPIGADGNINPTAPVNTVQFPDGFIGNPSGIETHWRLDNSLFYTGVDGHRFRIAFGGIFSKLDTEETKNFGPGVISGTLTDVTDTPFIFLDERERTIYFLSLQDEWHLAPDWDLTAGLRYDNYSDFGDTLNPRLALVWQTRYNLTTKLLYGRAFRPPSFQELFNQNNPVATGNPDLDPETIVTTELAFDYQPTFDIRTTLNLFRYEIKDLIEFISSGNGSGIAQNMGAQEGYGLEWELSWEANRSLELIGNYAYQNSTDKAANRNAGNAPRHQVYLQADWNFRSRWNLNGQFNWIADRARVAGDPRPDIKDYQTIDVLVRHTDILNHWDLSLMVRNIFDENAREPSPAANNAPAGSWIPNDYPLEGRSYSAVFKYRF
jgi:iron complex outermembrane receptor protein